MVTTCFETERDPAIRSTLVNIAWRADSSRAFPLLQQALNLVQTRLRQQNVTVRRFVPQARAGVDAQ